MSENFSINLLIVDRSLPDINRIVQILGSAGYAVQELYAELLPDIRDFIHYQPIDVIIVRQDEHLPTLAEIRGLVSQATQDIPILAVIDDPGKQNPVAALRAGADNFFYLTEPEHLLITVRKEIDHLRIRRESCSQQSKLKESEERCWALLASSHDAIAYIHEGAHSYANPAYLRLFGYADTQEIAGVTLLNLIAPSDRDKLKSFLRQSTKAGKSANPIALSGLDREGKQFPLHLECVLTHIDEEPCLQICIQNPAYGQMNQQVSTESAKGDELTGFYGRRSFTEHLERILTSAAPARGAVLYILMTDYRSLSEQLGLEAVDQLVIGLAKLLSGIISEKEVIARFSDAVFTIYTPESSAKAVFQLGERICAAVKAQVTHVGPKAISTTSSIGICMIQKNQETAMQILSQADRVCEIARQMGGNQAQIYLPLNKPTEPSQQERITGLIKDVIDGDRLSLLFQPIASFQGNASERYKAYLRMVGEDKKPMPMSALGPVIESRGLMGRLDKWVIHRSLQVARERREKLGRSSTLFIRVSQNSVIDESFLGWLEKRLTGASVEGNTLVIEVAEQCAEQHLLETKRLREHLRRLGCGFALSHCEGKVSSERLLNLLIPDYIKLDGALIEKLAKGRDEKSRQAVTSLTQQAQAKSILVVAADVATAPQMASIWQFGVTLVQGDMVQEASEQMEFDFQQFAG